MGQSPQSAAGLFGNVYHNKRVLITGHTGFKGSWLALWLERMGARVVGIARAPATEPSHYELLGLGAKSFLTDIRNADSLARIVALARPEIVFHLAAQPLVRRSYRDPSETYATNVIGTLNVCEACRACNSVRAIVAITTDKVYENPDSGAAFKETDPLGGYDPYSASKACAEILLASYRRSYFNPVSYGTDHHTLLASVRAGNVIGGGDWSEDRLLPDIMKAVGAGEPVILRNPQAVRPWQHVLECLSGYLLVGQRLYEGDPACARPFNFGPKLGDTLQVREIVERVRTQWPALASEERPDPAAPHEAAYLRLSCTAARTVLHWEPVWNIDTALRVTADWYREFYERKAVYSIEQLNRYIEEAREAGAVWAK